MSFLQFNYVRDEISIFDKYCNYCDEVILKNYIKITVNDTFIRFHVGQCWDKFVVGIFTINKLVLEKEALEIN